MAGHQPELVERYLHFLLENEAEGLMEIFATEPVIEDPRAGRVAGGEATLRFVESAHSWLGQRDARVEHSKTTRADERSVVESVLRLTLEGGTVALPVAVVGEGVDGLEEIRVYHSMWPLEGAHRLRPPLLREDPGLALSGAVEEYQRALAEGDAEKIVGAFEPDGHAREPSGGGYRHGGREGLRRFYEALFANGGGIPLEHCSVTDDGVCCAVEYNVVRWGRTRLPPQAGVAVYERGASGRLAAARIYDDVDPPLAEV